MKWSSLTAKKEKLCVDEEKKVWQDQLLKKNRNDFEEKKTFLTSDIEEKIDFNQDGVFLLIQFSLEHWFLTVGP